MLSTYALVTTFALDMSIRAYTLSGSDGRRNDIFGEGRDPAWFLSLDWIC